MGKIKDGDVTLNVVQVCEKLETSLTDSQKKSIGTAMQNLVKNTTTDLNPKELLAHSILDSYRFITGTDDATIEIRRCLKFVMEKYMKSTAIVQGETDAFINLLRCCAIED